MKQCVVEEDVPDEQRTAESIQTLKSLFPAYSVPKGKAMTLLRTKSGLTVEYEVSA